MLYIFKILPLCFLIVFSAKSQTVYVSPQGLDLNPGTKSSPVRTFKKAAYIAKQGGFSVVEFAAGEYFFEETVVLDASYSGITFQAAVGEQVVFSSLKKVNGWSSFQGNIMQADLPQGVNHPRYLQDKSENWLERSATMSFSTNEPAGGEDNGCIECNNYTESTQEDMTNIRYPSGFMEPDWRFVEQYDLRANTLPWHMEVLPLESVNISQKRIYTAVPALYDLRRDYNEPQPNRAWVLNTLEGIDKPGEWAILNGKVYLYPLSGTSDIYVPALTELIRIDNGISNGNQNFSTPVTNIVFDGITFTGADFRVMEEDDVTVQHDWMVVDEPDALLRIRNASDIAVKNCAFKKSGGTGLRLDRFAQNIVIEHNSFSYLGRGGINIAGRGPGYGDVSKNNTIAYNYLEHIGMEKWASIAILLDNSSNNFVHHNYITNTYFTGIAVIGPRQLMFAAQAEGAEDFYTGREFHFFEMAPSIMGFMEENGGVLEGSQEAMRFVYNYNNRVEENALVDVCTGQGIFVNGQIYVSGSQRSTGVEDLKTNFFERNYLYDSYNHSVNDYAIYSDSDQDDCNYIGNMIHGVSNGDDIPFDLPVILAFNQWAETENFGFGNINLKGNLSENVSFCRDGEEEGEECTHTLGANHFAIGNIINGTGADVSLLELYQEMFLTLCDANFPQVDEIPGAETVRQRLISIITEFGGTIPDCDTCNDCETCEDGIQNQGEEGIDCGGPCAPCETAPTCEVPTGLYADELGSSRARLNWMSVERATNYTVEIRLSGASSWYSFRTTQTNLTIRGLSNNADYEWRVSTNCTDSESSWSEACTINVSQPESGNCGNAGTDPEPTCEDGVQNQGEEGIDCGGPCAPCEATPTCEDGIQNQGEEGIDCGGPCADCATCAAPDKLSVDGFSRTQATFHWQSVSGAASFVVEVRPEGSTRWYSFRTSDTEMTIRGLSRAIDYEWRVKSVCSGEESNWSDACLFNIGDPASGNCGNTATEPEPTCEDGIQNQGEEGIDCGGPCAPCEATPTCEDGIQNQGEEGIDCGGPCAPCEATPTCEDGIQNQEEEGIDCGGPCEACNSCGVPERIYADNISRGRARLNWGEVPGATAYQLEVRLSGTSRWYSTRTSATNITLRGISNGRSYEWRVSAICGTANGDWTIMCSFTGGEESSGSCVEGLSGSQGRFSIAGQVSIYPNPANDLLNVIYRETDAPVAVSLIDLQGRTWKAANLSANGRLQLDVSDLPAGVYFLIVKSGGNFDYRQIVIQ